MLIEHILRFHPYIIRHIGRVFKCAEPIHNNDCSLDYLSIRKRETERIPYLIFWLSKHIHSSPSIFTSLLYPFTYSVSDLSSLPRMVLTESYTTFSRSTSLYLLMERS